MTHRGAFRGEPPGPMPDHVRHAADMLPPGRPPMCDCEVHDLSIEDVLRDLDRMEADRHDPTVSVRRYAARATSRPWKDYAAAIRAVIAAGVSVPTEPGAPDLVPPTTLSHEPGPLPHELWVTTQAMVTKDQGDPAWSSGARFVMDRANVLIAALLASQPVPAPEPSYPRYATPEQRRWYMAGWEAGLFAKMPAPEPSSRLDVEIAAEVERAQAKFGDQFDFTNGDWLAVITEEVGEAATECLRVKFFDPAGLLRRSNETGIPVEESDFPAVRLRAEVVQVAAVARRWIAALDARLAATPQDPEA